MIRAMIMVLALLLGTAPAFAARCPKDMARIDAAMQTAQLSDADRARVAKLRKDGEELHKAGRHAESVQALGEAMAALKIN